MTRSPSRLPLVVVGPLLAIAVVVGCRTRTEDPSSRVPVAQPVGAATKASTPADIRAPLLADWPKQGLEGALLISGEQIGYLEPCGCTAGQRGGLARRLDLVQRLRAQGWKLALIDLGSLINDPNSHGGPIETRIRYTYALKALELIGYNALALSPTDLKLGVGEVLTQYMNYLGDRLKIVSANVAPDPGLGLDKKIVPSLRTEVGAVAVGVTAVIDPAGFAQLSDPDKDLMLTSRDPGAVLPGVLADLERDTQVQILMVQGPPEAAKRLAQEYPGFEVVVATSPFVEPPRDAEGLNGGKTQLISVGKKGQYVGVLGLYKDAEPKLRYRRIDLNLRYNGKTEAMRKLIDEDFQDALRQAGVLESYPRRAYVFASNLPSDATFVGALACKTCHPRTYEHWAGTKHARAYDSLAADPKRNRTSDAECINCHTVGFEYQGGFLTAEETPHLMGVQCESCHGPGSKHLSDPGNLQFREAMARDKEDFDKNQRCVECHTEDDSPHFDFAKYWPEVEHKGLDSGGGSQARRGGQPARVARQDEP